MAGPLHLKVFLSSPGDVAEERDLARQLIKDELPYDPLLRGKVTFDVFSWDDPATGVPLLASMTPQEAVNRVDRPANCHITIVILWSRLGSPLRTDVFRKPSGEPYRSGTEWEFEDARAAGRDVLVYRRTAKVLLDDEAPEFEERREQKRRVREFFDRFRNPDGSFNAAAASYVAPADLKERLAKDLKALVARRLAADGAETAPNRGASEGQAPDKTRVGTASRPPQAATPEAERSVAGTWFKTTVLRATTLLGMIAAYLGALGAVFRWFGDDFKAFREQDPWLFWPLVALPLLFIAAFSVGPELWARHRRRRRESLTLGADTTVPSAGYFRLDPHTADQPGGFNRADGAHERVLRWLRATPRPVLFLSGASGTGKSSLLEAYVLPALEREGWRVEVVRSFADSLAGLEAALRGRRGKVPPLLVVFDQFEEFVILEGRAASEAGRRFLTRVHELRERPPPGVHLLFVVRSDYLNAIVELGLEELASGQTWQEIDPFKRGAARAFLAGSPLRPTAELLERLLDGAEALEEAKGLFRPVTLNMLGLALQDFDRQVTRRPERLIQAYLEAALAQVGVREIAPKVVAGLISEAGTKRPRELDELAAEARLSGSEVKLCLARLAAKGLVRPLDAARSLWEISHDFVAKQLAVLLGRLRPSPWPRIALWSAPLLFALAIGTLTVAAPLIYERQTLQELQRRGAIFSEEEGRSKIDFAESFNDLSLEEIAPFIARYNLSILDLSGTQVSDLAPLQGLANLQTLYLSGTEVSDLAPLQGLANLQTLDLTDTEVTDLAPLQDLTNLQALYLTATEVSDLAPLQGLANLQTLALGGTQVSDLAPLQGLANLQTLALGGTQVSDLAPLQGLTNLQTLYLSGTQVSDLAPLQGLANLQTLDLSGTQVSDLAPLQGLANLQTLDLSGTEVSDLAPLQGLANLQTLYLSGTQVSDLAPLQGLANLQTLYLSGTQVSDLAPLQGLANLQTLDLSLTKVSDLVPLQGLTNLQTLYLSRTEVTDLAPLQDLTNLQTLNLSGTEVTDLAPLHGLKQLTIER